MTGYIIELAKTGRARCKRCENLIEEDTVRVGREFQIKDQPAMSWHHLHCLTQNFAASMLKHGSAASIPGMDTLSEQDRAAVAAAIERIADGTDAGEAVPKSLIGPRTGSDYPRSPPKMSKKKAMEAREKEEEAAMGPATPPKKGRRSKKKAAEIEAEGEEEGEGLTLEEGEAMVVEAEGGGKGKNRKKKKKKKVLDELNLPYMTTSGEVP